MLERLLGTAWGWGAFALACIVWAVALIPATALIARFDPRARERLERTTRAVLGRYVSSLPFLRLQVERTAQRPAGDRILVANHQSWLDPIVMIGIEPGVRGPARGGLFRVPALASLLRLLGFYPARAAGPPRGESGVDAQEAGGGGALLFFPEGTRSRDGEVAPFQRGAFRLAFDRGLPIQPVVIEGLDRILPPGVLLVRNRGRGRVRVRYLPPLVPPFGEGIRRDVVRELAERVHRHIAEELARMRRDPPAP